MNKLNLSDVSEYVENNIGTFHRSRLESIKKLQLNNIIKRKNPYLFKAKSILTAQDFVKTILDAYLSSQEETIFGDFLENLAIFVNKKVYGGWKSGIDGIDLEFDKDKTRFIVAIKSGPHWGNKSQIAKLRSDFLRAKQTLRTSRSEIQTIAINGCCYGRCKKTDKGDYYKYCGQEFWQFISGNNNLYTEIVEPLGYKAKEKNEEFFESYAQILNKFTLEFGKIFCKDGKINWEELVRFNSSRSNSKKIKISI